MGLFDHLKAPKGKVWISFDKPTFVEGEAVVGKVNVEAGEYVQSLGVKVEARVFENYTELVWITINNTRVQEHERRQNVLFSRDVVVTGPNDFGSGPGQRPSRHDWSDTGCFPTGRQYSSADARVHAWRIPGAAGLWSARIQSGL